MKDTFYFISYIRIFPTIVQLLIVVRNGIGFSNVTGMRDIAYYALVIELSQMSEEYSNQD